MIEFDEQTHTYTDQIGTSYTSVTQLLGEKYPFDQENALKAIRRAKNSIYKGMTDEEILNKWQEVTQIGTDLHQEVDRAFKLGLHLNKVKRKVEEGGSVEFHAGAVNRILNGNWRGDVITEKRVWCEKVGLAGTIDFIDDLGTKQKIYDLKTSRKMDSEKLRKYWLQMRLYKYLLEVTNLRLLDGVIDKNDGVLRELVKHFDIVPLIPKVECCGIIWLEDYANNPDVAIKFLTYPHDDRLLEKEFEWLLKEKKETTLL